MKQIKTIKGLALELCRREKKKKQVNIAQMSETLGHLSDILFENEEFMFDNYAFDVVEVLHINGIKRAKKKAKPCRK